MRKKEKIRKKSRGLMAEFKEFALKGNVIDLAVGVIIGAAFQAIINALVQDMIMPVIGAVTGGVDFTNQFIIIGKAPPGADVSSLEAARKVTSVFAYGSFITAVIHFIIMAFAIFMLVKAINALRGIRLPGYVGEPEAPSEKECAFCKKTVAYEALRCPYCTSELTK